MVSNCIEYIIQKIDEWIKISVYEDFDGVEIVLKNIDGRIDKIFINGIISDSLVKLIYKMNNLKRFEFNTRFSNEYTEEIFTTCLPESVEWITINNLSMVSPNFINRNAKTLEIIYFNANQTGYLYNLLIINNVKKLNIIYFENENENENRENFTNSFKSRFPNIELFIDKQ